MVNTYHSAWREVGSSCPPVSHGAPCPSQTARETSKGTWFDDALDFRDPEGEALTRAALALIVTVDHRARKRRPGDEERHRTIVRRLLANGLRCKYFRRPSLITYYRRAGHKHEVGWLSGKAVSRTVDLMAKAGLIGSFVGEWGVSSSTYSVTEKLAGMALACGVTQHSLTMRLPPKRLVRLRQGDSRTPMQTFEPTGDTLRWAGRLWAYNAFLAQQEIRLLLSPVEEAEWVRRWNEDRAGEGVRLSRPELVQTDLYRQFNNGSFGQGGRLYGGWWINTPKALRRKITINDEPSAELDFSGCAIRMLYHERGLDYRDDPYQLSAVAEYEREVGLAAGHFREGVKAITQALINDRGGKKPEMIRLPSAISFHPRFKRSDIREMIESKHAPIADAFGTGSGLRLQRVESDLALTIVSRLMKAGMVGLPVHDSFIVALHQRDSLFAMMDQEYRNRFSFHPIIR